MEGKNQDIQNKEDIKEKIEKEEEEEIIMAIMEIVDSGNRRDYYLISGINLVGLKLIELVGWKKDNNTYIFKHLDGRYIDYFIQYLAEKEREFLEKALKEKGFDNVHVEIENIEPNEDSRIIKIVVKYKNKKIYDYTLYSNIIYKNVGGGLVIVDNVGGGLTIVDVEKELKNFKKEIQTIEKNVEKMSEEIESIIDNAKTIVKSLLEDTKKLEELAKKEKERMKQVIENIVKKYGFDIEIKDKDDGICNRGFYAITSSKFERGIYDIEIFTQHCRGACGQEFIFYTEEGKKEVESII